jgi:hypothetical protein
MVGIRVQTKNNNRYNTLFNEPECYICHIYGHKAVDCRLKNYKPESNHRAENVKVWKKNEDNKCGLVFSAQKQKDSWYIDIGCFSHMMGDKSKSLSLKKNKSRSVNFGNDALGKTIGKGLASLSNGRSKDQDVLFVDGLKNNHISVSKICDRGREVTFTAKNYKIKIVNTGEILAKGVRTKNNVYILKEDKEKCCLRKIEESWLWHRRLGHLNFDDIVKLKNEGVVKDLPKLSKPNKSLCASCQMGNLTHAQFKSKSFTSSEKPLQLVHIDLCGPSRK